MAETQLNLYRLNEEMTFMHMEVSQSIADYCNYSLHYFTLHLIYHLNKEWHFSDGELADYTKAWVCNV